MSSRVPVGLAQVRRICLSLPGATEVKAWGTATFRCGRIFVMYAPAGSHASTQGRPGIWLNPGPGQQALMVRDRPERLFVPPYLGKAGWVGVWLDRRPAWKEIALLVKDSFRLIAPASRRRALDS